MIDTILSKAKNLEPYIIEKRRDIHKHPELGFEEERTSELVCKELENFGYDVKKTCDTGVIGTLNKNKDGETLALRADMDALPINETQDPNHIPNKEGFRSVNEGIMHACGHDAHTAMLLGASKILSDIRQKLNGTVKLIFQPAEEGGGGAKKLINESKLGKINAIFSLHVLSDQPLGVISTKPGPVHASSVGIKIEIQGKGGHAAYPHETRDPTSVAVDIYNAIQKIQTRCVDPFSSIVVSTPLIETSERYSVIPDRVKIEGTLRTFDEKLRDNIIEKIRKIVKNYSKAWQCEGNVDLIGEPYPPNISTPELADFAMKTAKNLGPVEVAKKRMGSEDFAFYLKEYPGAQIFLGTRNEDKGIIYPHHHPKFDLDEEILYKGTSLHALLGYKYLSE